MQIADIGDAKLANSDDVVTGSAEKQACKWNQMICK